jgi:hypothetical protein
MTQLGGCRTEVCAPLIDDSSPAVAASSIHARRRADPAFAEAFEAALALASTNVECAIIQAADRTFGGDWVGGIDADGPRMTVGQAIAFLRTHQRRGR